MSKIAFLFTLLSTVLVFLLPAMPARAAAARTFVSAAGSDSNNCTNVATPCRHLATAYAATAANGEIYVLDPANYGSLTITGPVSIEGHGWASISPVAGGEAITINANPGDKINIIGVVLDGSAITNTYGILVTAGGSVIVRDSIIRNFTNSGISFGPTCSTPCHLFVSNTLVSDNGINGIIINAGGPGTVSGVLDHIQIENNANNGLDVEGEGQTVNFTIADSVIANSGADGVVANNSPAAGQANIMVRNSTIANNAGNGLKADTSTATATISVTRSTITGNGAGWQVGQVGVVLSYGDNNIDGNTNTNIEPPNPLTYK